MKQINQSNEDLRKLNESKIGFNIIESISEFASMLNEGSIIIDELEIFKPEIGLGNKKQQDAHKKGEGDTNCVIRFSEMMNSNFDNIPVDKITCKDFFTPYYRTMVYGNSNVGKSYFMLQCALCFASGISAFFFKSTTPLKVLYIESEMNKSLYGRVKQLSDNNFTELIDKNLLFYSKLGLSLEDKTTYSEILELIDTFKPDIVIIDNLLTLFAKSIIGNSFTIYNFCQDVEKRGAAVVMVHHTGKDGLEYKGSSDLGAKCQNIIHLIGRDQIADFYKKNLSNIPNHIIDSANSGKNGPVIAVHIEKNKVSGGLEYMDFFYRLPIKGHWEEIGTVNPQHKGITETDCGGNDVDSCEDKKEVTEATLNDEELKIVEVAGPPNGVKNADVRKLIDCGSTKATNLLGKLEDMGRLKRIGDGRSTHYVRN